MKPSNVIVKLNAPSRDESNRSPSFRNRDTVAKQNRLLVTKTVRLKKEEINVRYAELGDPTKPSVLLLHGVPENLQAWYAVAPRLAEKYHVLALDWPGFAQQTIVSIPSMVRTWGLV